MNRRDDPSEVDCESRERTLRRIRLWCFGAVVILAPVAFQAKPAAAAVDGGCVLCTDSGASNCGNTNLTCPGCSSCIDPWGYVRILHRKAKT